jgi:hypothetical protein
MLDNQVLHMTPGETLAEAPIQDMIQKLGCGIAEAQLRLDQTAVKVATLLSGARVELTDAQGKATSKSLLELGFTPTFYHFTEAELEIKMSISMKVEENFGVGISANVGNDAGSIQQATQGAMGAAQGASQTGKNPANNGGNAAAGSSGGGDKRAVMFGAAINVEYHRKYSFDVTGSSTVRAKMISVPAPAAFLEMLKEQARTGGSVGASPDATGNPAAPAVPVAPAVPATPAA